MKIGDMTIDFSYGYENHVGEELRPFQTFCTIRFADGETLWAGATCHEDDNFNKSKGRAVSLARALQSLPRAQRKEIWTKYMHGRKRP